MNMYQTRLPWGERHPFRRRAAAAVAAAALLAVAAGCGSVPAGKIHQASVLKGTVAQLKNQLDKQEVVVDDLGKRITELENIILGQQYELKKLKAASASVKMESVNIAPKGADEEVGIVAGDGGTVAAVVYSVAEPEASSKSGGAATAADDGERPVLKLYGEGSLSFASKGGSAGSAALPQDDFSSLASEAAVAANYVPLTLKPYAIKEGGGGGGGSGGGASSGSAAATAPKEPPLVEAAPAVSPYDAGAAKYKEGKYSDAIVYFDIFLKGAPAGSKTANALFLKGESLFQLGKIVEALGVFELVESKYPSWDRIPETKLRMGRCYEKMGDKKKAAQVYESIVQDYPDSQAAKKALARMKKIEQG